MRATFRTKLFLAVFGVAAAGLVVAAILLSVSLGRQTYARIETHLVAEARLAAELLAHRVRAASPGELDEEADRLGRDIAARVTFIAPDGQVVGDSEQDSAALKTLENHGHRPEVVAARSKGLGIERRYSTTIGTDMLYVAIPTRNPSVAVVRLALPLTEIDRQVRSIQQATLIALGLALLSALGLAWLSSAALGRRVQAIAATARQYAAGDLLRSAHDFGDDELGTVARVLSESVRELARQVAEMTQARARMEAILTGMVEGILMVGPQGTLQLVNQAAVQMLKLDAAPAGRHYLEVVRHPAVVERIRAALEGQEPEGAEISLGSNGGQTLVARAAPISPGGGGGAVLVLHDITDLRLADRMRRDFVANVSHELRTPLTAIRGYAEALRDDPTDPDERQRFVEIIVRHTTRMERLVTDLLRLARLAAGQELIEQAPCSTDSLLRSVAADLAPMLETKRQRVEVRVEPSAATIVTDGAKLQDALRNLVENAVNYSPEGTTIQMEASRRDGQIVVTVADEGPGIPEADLTRIFERFYRVDKARSRETGGTGLGLSIVKHLVERLGGDVRATNRPGSGAVLIISLPQRAAG